LITAIDTNVLSDVFRRDPAHYDWSSNAVRLALSQGALVACGVVWAEIAAAFPTGSEAAKAMAHLTIGFDALDQAACLRCGEAWSDYRKAGGSRDRVIADFMIASHALSKADRLLTRDRGFYRRYFPELVLLNENNG
jgi:predicted nucleic acid-binding protein